MSHLTDVTVILDGTPSKALHKALTGPINNHEHDFPQRLALIDMHQAGGHKVYTGTVYAACFNHVLLHELEDFFRGIPASMYGSTRGIVTVDDEDEPGFIVNRVGWQA